MIFFFLRKKKEKNFNICFIFFSHAWAALKRHFSTQPVFTLCPFTQNKSSPDVPLCKLECLYSSYCLAVAYAIFIAYIHLIDSATLHFMGLRHCRVPFIVITAERNVNVCFKLCIPTITTKCYKL